MIVRYLIERSYGFGEKKGAAVKGREGSAALHQNVVHGLKWFGKLGFVQ